MSERIDLTHAMGRLPIGKLILKMSVPSILGVMAYNVYNLFDTMIVSRLGCADAYHFLRICGIFYATASLARKGLTKAVSRDKLITRNGS